MKIKCESCFKEYDDSHLQGMEDEEKRWAADFDGWNFGFFTECPECQEKAKNEQE